MCIIDLSAKGVVKVLVCSEDAGKCLDAYKSCQEPGKIVYIRKGHIDKRKTVIVEPEAKAVKAKAVKK